MLFFLACASPSPTPPPAPAPAATPAPAPAPTPYPGLPMPDRLVAIGDIHGDPTAALVVMKMAGLVDAAGKWVGGKTTLVQTGDITDRGPDSKGVIALLQRLQGEAPQSGGMVVPLLGNHETMNMLGDWRYVSEQDLAGYGGEEARKAAFSEAGEDGRWLRSLDATAKVGDTVFAHGGIDESWARVGIEKINTLVHVALKTSDKAALVLGPDGPLWNRGYVLEEEAMACPRLVNALKSLGASRMVVGHTTQESGQVLGRCEGRLWVIDTGLSAHYGNHYAALEITPSAVTPLYPK